MAASPSSNLVTVMRAFVGLAERGEVDTITSLLSPDVVWQGLEPELRCEGRQEVRNQMSRGFARAREFTAFSASCSGDEVAVSVEGPELRDWLEPELQGSAHLVLTFTDGLVTSIQATRTGEEALSL